ncbi:MAG: tyrosine-type recombinase/integrase [Deltaproteobacteria bacterium]|nr:tyrosine-type recombinase/integrase [Deltaproteobacteria bacterium]
MRLSQAIETFMRSLKANGRSPHTVSYYRRDLKLLLAFAGDAECGELDADLVNRFVLSDAVQRSAGGAAKSQTSVGRTKAALKSFGRFLADVGVVSASPAAGLRIQRRPREEPAHLTPAERKLLVKAVAARGGEAAERDLVILDLFLSTGIRLAELVGLDVGDVRLDDKRMVLRRVKGGRAESRFLNSDLRAMLGRYLRARRRLATNETALFLSNRGTRITARQVERRFGEWLAWAGISKPLTVHSLRHYPDCRIIPRGQRRVAGFWFERALDAG